MADGEWQRPCLSFKNDIVHIDAGGRRLSLVSIIMRPHKDGGEERPYFAHFLSADLVWLDRIFPHTSICLSNGNVAIESRTPYGERFKPYVGPVLLYRGMLESWKQGDPRPSTKGWTARYGRLLGPLFLLPENYWAEDARPSHSRSGHKTGWIMDWRLKCLAEGKSPDTLKERSEGENPEDVSE